MENDKKNNLLYTGILAVILLFSIYVVSSKFFSNTDTNSQNAENIYKTQGKTPAPEKIDSIFEFSTDSFLVPFDTSRVDKTNPNVEKLPSLEELDTEMQKTISRIETNLDKAYQLQPDNVNRKKLLLKTDLIIDSALSAYENPFLNVMKGDLKMLQGENVKAVDAYEKALLILGNIPSIERNHAGACYNAAIDLIKRNDTDRAIVLMEQFYNFSKTDENGRALLIDWYKKRAVGLLRAGKNEDGLSLVRKAIELNPSDHVAHFNAGIALFRLLDYNKAIKKFKLCLELNPADNYSKNYLYAIYMQKGDTANAALYETESTVIKIPVKQ